MIESRAAAVVEDETLVIESIAYLKTSDDAWKTGITGGVLLLFGFPLIPPFLVRGYVVRVLDRTARGDDEPPVFEDWGELTIDGAKAFVILLAYSLVALSIGGVLFSGVSLAAGGTPESIGTTGTVLSGLVAAALLVAAAYGIPAALANFAAEQRLGAGFDLGALRPVLSSGTYATGWLIALGIVVVGSFVSGALDAVPFLGTALGAIVAFYALVAAYHVIGCAWRDLHPLPVDETNGEPSAERPVV